MGVQISLQYPVFISLDCKPRCRSARSYGSSSFNFLRNHHTVSVMAEPVYILQNVQRFPFLQLCQLLLLLIFLMLAIHRCEVVSHCTFIYMSGIISSVEHLFMYLLAFWMSLDTCLFHFSAHFLIRSCEVFVVVMVLYEFFMNFRFFSYVYIYI